jgi:hypothetical protein
MAAADSIASGPYSLSQPVSQAAQPDWLKEIFPPVLPLQLSLSISHSPALTLQLSSLTLLKSRHEPVP